MKLEFKYLKTAQAWWLLKAETALLGIEIEDKVDIKRAIQNMRKLTPGDFAAVRRQHRFRPIVSILNFVERLREEVEVKEESVEKKMGFM
jgi:hypothetical protein